MRVIGKRAGDGVAAICVGCQDPLTERDVLVGRSADGGTARRLTVDIPDDAE